MKNLKQSAEDLVYILEEIESTLKRNQEDIPDSILKIIKDLCYYGERISRGLVVDCERCIISRDNRSL